MLTLPSDSLPHLVFPMDGEAMTPHSFCSAPPHSEPSPPPPPLLPLPSITPRASDGTSGHRRSGRIQAIKPQGARVEEMVETPSTYNPSSFKRHSNNMVQVSQAKQARVESTFEDDKHKQDCCDFNTAAEFQNTEKDFAEEHDQRLPESLVGTTACEAADVSASAPAGWLTGPLFQSLKSKMASFTEIVMSPVSLFKDKKLSTPEVQPDKTDMSSKANREPWENGRREAKESSFTWELQPGSDSCLSRRLFSTSPDGIQVPLPASQEVPLLQERTVKMADVIEEAKVSTRLNTRPTKPKVEKHFHFLAHDVSALETRHVDGHETNSDFVRSKSMLSTQVQAERKRQKSEMKKNVAEPPPLKTKVSDGQEAPKRAAKCRDVKRKVQGDERDDGSGKSEQRASGRLAVASGNITVRKRKSLVPTPPHSSVQLPAPGDVAAPSEGAPNVGRAKPIKRLKKAPRGELQAQTKKTQVKLGQAQMSIEPQNVEMTPFEGKQLECSDQDASASRLCNGRANRKQTRGDPRSRRSGFSRTHAHNGTTSATTEDLPTSTGQSASAGRLLRSYSCPELPSISASLPCQPPLAPAGVPGASQRPRRHTVSCMEVERELAPLCLRKEVYPSRREGQSLPPDLSLSALASCFLSSPLAFLSGRAKGRAAAAGIAASSHTASSSAASPKTDCAFGALEACASASVLAGGTDGSTAPSEEDEDTGSSSHEFDEATASLKEEKSLSDSELKAARTHEHHGKVSSIRIRRALPKPQNNLTPMGLPKAVRLNKKQFSLEEIYTNKNFSKPPESRLETIFEVPLSRRDGSASRFGRRRLKRVLEFHEVGEARKPKKVPAGGGKAVAASSRTRRGGVARDDASLAPLPAPDADSLLCAKLKQLDLWLINDQADAAC